jgi:hypothetical protein
MIKNLFSKKISKNFKMIDHEDSSPSMYIGTPLNHLNLASEDATYHDIKYNGHSNAFYYKNTQQKTYKLFLIKY